MLYDLGYVVDVDIVITFFIVISSHQAFLSTYFEAEQILAKLRNESKPAK